jgi:2-polyprenyl-6-methoxyphenol hydroxylase-like FAD-dependent oxidoreductase
MTQSVLIIGAGPVGLTLAIELARYAVPVRIVEKAARRTDKSKALVLWSRTLELLDRQPGGSTPFIEAGFKVDAVSFLAGGEQISRVSMKSVDSPYPYALMIRQSDTEASVYWHKDGAFVVFPISPGRYRLLADLPPSGEAQPPAPTLEQVQAMIDRRGPPGTKAFDPIWLAGFRINGRKVSDYRWGRAFLCGDAAHVHSPAGGQGMNTGMQDAFNLAWKLAAVVNGLSGEKLLDSYSAERSEVGEHVLADAQRLTAVGTMKNPVGQAVRNAVGHLILGLAPVQHVLAGKMTEVAIGYPKSPMNGPGLGGGPQPGARIAPIVGQAPVGSAASPRLALFATSTAATAGLIEQFPNVLDPEVRPPVREDGYGWSDPTVTLPAPLRPTMRA